MAVSFINCFEIPVGREDEFLALYGRINAYMADKPGFIANKMHRALAPDARFRFVNVASWETKDDFSNAHGPELRAMLGDVWFKSWAALYEVVHERTTK